VRVALLFLFGDEVMQVVSEEVCAVDTSVAVEDPEVCCLFPVHAMFRFGDVQDDGDSVFVVLADGSLVSGGGVGLDISAGVFGVFGGFEVRDGYEDFGEYWILILVGFEFAFFWSEVFGL
jgi:hypothetical protein